MGLSGKWIEGIDPEGVVGDAARRSLGARLTAVAHWLPLAAYHASQDEEHVHRLRVNARRAMAAVKLYRNWLPEKPLRWVKKRLKKIRRAAGDARDLDVLAARLRRELGDEAAPVFAEIDRRRASAQPAIVCVAEKCRRNDRFVRRIAQLLDGIRPPRGADESELRRPFREWAQKQLAEAAEPFFNGMPGADSGAAVLHQFRIRGKALRYAIELLSPAFGPELRENVYPQIEQLQERLGRIQDQVAGGVWLAELRREMSDPELQSLLDARHGRGDSRLQELITDFQDWWTPARADGVRKGLFEAAALPPIAFEPQTELESSAVTTAEPIPPIDNR